MQSLRRLIPCYRAHARYHAVPCASTTQRFCEELEETCVSAGKEYGLEQAMEKMENDWAHMNFETKPYRNTGGFCACVLRAWSTCHSDECARL
jgi:Dynein heavy chain, N-terminal region 2